MFTKTERLMISILIAAALLALVTMFLEHPKADVNSAEQYLIKWEKVDTEPPTYRVEQFSNPVTSRDVVPPFTETRTQETHTPPVPSVPAAHGSGERLTKSRGVFNGPSGRETYYNLDMSVCIRMMRGIGYSEAEYPVWVRDDGAKMFGDYVMCAANLDIRPKGTVIETSLGLAIVVDTGSFAKKDVTGVDLCVNW